MSSSSFSRKSLAVAAAEFLGTALLTLVVMAITRSYLPYPFFIASGVGLALAAATLTMGRVSGAHFNPAITLGLWSVRRISGMRAIVYVAAQLLGGIAAVQLFSYFISQPWVNSGTSNFQAHVLVAEAVGAFILSMGYATVVYQKLETSKAASVVGLSVFLAMLIAFAGTGGIVNPAIALGLKSWVWTTYVLGPVLGSVIGFNLYSLLFAPEGALAVKEEAVSAPSEVGPMPTKSVRVARAKAKAKLAKDRIARLLFGSKA